MAVGIMAEVAPIMPRVVATAMSLLAESIAAE